MTGGQDELAEDLKGDEPRKLEPLMFNPQGLEQVKAVAGILFLQMWRDNSADVNTVVTIDNHRLRIRISRED